MSPFSLTLSSLGKAASSICNPICGTKMPQDIEVQKKTLQTVSAEQLRDTETVDLWLQENDENQNLYCFQFQVI